MRALLAIAAVMSASLAHATPHLEIRPSPGLELRIAPTPRGADTVLLDGQPMPATIVDDARPIAIAFVICGNSVWIGRDKLPPGPETDGDYREPGALEVIKATLAHTNVTHGWPAGSESIVVTYGNGIQIRDLRHRIDHLRIGALGDQDRYDREQGNMLAQGIEVGIDQLTAANTPRRAIIVLGDGFDDRVAQLPPEHVRRRLVDGDAELISIVWRGPLGSAGGNEAILDIAPDSMHVATANDIQGALAGAIDDLRHRKQIVVNSPELPWDGGIHTLEVRHGSTTAVATLVWLPERSVGKTAER